MTRYRAIKRAPASGSSLPSYATWWDTTTFSDATDAVRMTLWGQNIYRQYPPDPDIPKIHPSRVKRMTQALCFAV
ncbi:hypothetical protein [Mesorhizobium sp. GR13]|uniref:hypothetical protein n=1 Tax=Mesorhizobium sp. GR13 TaxID=2562308 RepID=UPI0010C086A0|nr:hypothetical protein [Mesorhizobium sp. GR13]